MNKYFLITLALIVLLVGYLYMYGFGPDMEISGLSYCHTGFGIGMEHCHWAWETNHIH